MNPNHDPKTGQFSSRSGGSGVQDTLRKAELKVTMAMSSRRGHPKADKILSAFDKQHKKALSKDKATTLVAAQKHANAAYNRSVQFSKLPYTK